MLLSKQSQRAASPGGPLFTRASIPYWDQKNATESLTANIALFDQVALFWYYIDETGTVTKYEYATEDTSILTRAQQRGIKTFFTLTNLGEKENETWDSRRVETVIKDEPSRTRHINDILSIFERLPFDGVNIDYEQVAPAQRENFSDFIEELAERLHQRGKLLSVALHPITDRESEKRYNFQDYRAIAESADTLEVMAYEEHYDEGEPGPAASAPWVEEIINYVGSKKVPKEKVLLGIPLYGYDWTRGSDSPANSLVYRDIVQLQADFQPEVRWDNRAQTPSFTYRHQDQTHEVWFEDARSVEHKLALARDAGLGGVYFWRLGGEDPAVWTKVPQFR